MSSSEDPTNLAADGDEVLGGIEPPSVDKQLQYLKDHGWSDGDD